MLKHLSLIVLILSMAAGADARGRGRRGPDLSDNSKEELIAILKTHPDAKLRSAAAGQLGLSGRYEGDSESREALVAAYSGDAEPRVRASAVYSLSSRKEKTSFKMLLAGLSAADTHADVKSAIAWTICRFEDDAAVPVLLEAIKVRSLRFEAAHCLGELKAKDSVQPLIDVILDNVMHGDDGRDFVDSNAEMVESAEALGKIGHEKGLIGVMPMLAEHRSDYQRQTALRAIGAIGAAPGNHAETLSEIVMPTLLGHMDPANVKQGEVRLAALHAMDGLSDDRVVPALQGAFLKDPSYRVRSAAADALIRMKKPCLDEKGAESTCNVFKDIEKRIKDGNWDSGN